MNLKLKYIGLVIVVFLLYACSSDTNTPVKSVDAVEYKDRKYGDNSEQEYDIFLPENRDLTTPVIILVHGGSWIAGDKSDMNLIVSNIKLTLPNFAIANMNYRLLTTTENKHPTQINDIDLLIQELKKKQNDYQISNDFYFLGVSAGAHLSLLYSYTKDSNGDVKAVCSIVGPTNFTDEAYLNSGNVEFELLMTNFLGDTYENNPQLYEDASPLFHVNSSSTPTVLFYGGQDPLIPTSQGTDLKDKLVAFDVEHQFTLYADEGHGWDGVNAVDTMTKITAFFNNINSGK